MYIYLASKIAIVISVVNNATVVALIKATFHLVQKSVNFLLNLLILVFKSLGVVVTIIVFGYINF